MRASRFFCFFIASKQVITLDNQVTRKVLFNKISMETLAFQRKFANRSAINHDVCLNVTVEAHA